MTDLFPDDPVLDSSPAMMSTTGYGKESARGGDLPPAASEQLSAERRQLTVLHCRRRNELRGSGLDIEDIFEHEQTFRTLFKDCLDFFNGHLAHTLQDDFVAYFGYPAAQEDSARRAVLAGLRLIDQLKRLEMTQYCHVYIGIHTGEVIVDTSLSSEADIRISPGPTQAAALDLSEQADAHCVAVSETTARIIGRFFEFKLPELQLRSGKSQPRHGYRILEEQIEDQEFGLSSRGNLTPFVGRDVEIAWLRERWQAVGDGIGQIVLISGEAGVGKSRLVERFLDTVTGEPQLIWECRCSPYHGSTAFFPLARLLNRVLAKEAAETTDAVGRINALARNNNLNVKDVLPLLHGLLSLPVPDEYAVSLATDPQERHQQILNCLISFFLNRMGMEASILIIEDVHWADPSTLKWIDLLVNHVPTSRLLVLVTYRPEFEPTWTYLRSVTPLKLHRMDSRGTKQMLLHLTDGKKLPSKAVQQISSKTDGIPLFIEEFTKALLESGQLLETQDSYELTWPIDQLSIPLTLKESLMERLDKLPAGKVIAQWGAVLGREFSLEVLVLASPLDEQIRELGLKELLDAGLIYQQNRDDKTRFLFKHALVRDVAYQSILSKRRRLIHHDVARLLEERFPELVATQSELVAEHYARAERLEEAIPYWIRAGQRFIEQGAYREAINHLTTSLDALQDLPDTVGRARQELDVRISLGPCFSASCGPAHENVKQCFEQALSICRRLGETPHMFPTLANLWRLNHSGAHYRKAKQLGDQLLARAKQEGDVHQLQSAHQALGTSLFIIGELETSSDHLELSLGHADQIEAWHADVRYSHDPIVLALSFLTLARVFRGDPAEAIECGARLHEFAEELQHPHSRVLAVHFCMNLYWYLGDLPKVHRLNERKRSLASDHGFPHFIALSDIFGGWLMAKEGRGKEAAIRISQGLADFKATGSLTGITLNQSILADGFGMVGLIDDGLETLDQTLDLVESTGERFAEAEIYRMKGELLLRQDAAKAEKAEGCFLKALTIARQQGAKWWELRTATSLAKLLIRKDKSKQAFDLLGPICRRFTRSIASPYVLEAKALLA